MKGRIFCILLTILLLSSSFVLLVANGQTASNVKIEPKVPKIHINADSVLNELGYNYTSETAPQKLMIQILRSYQIDKGVMGEDGELYYTISPNARNDTRSIVGSDSVIPYEVSTTIHVKSSNNTSNVNGAELTDYLQEGKAALVFAIWDYPGDLTDLTDFGVPQTYDDLCNYITSCGQYTYWHFMTNGDCTWYYVWAWTTWACAQYSDVDITWIGHGGDVGFGNGFCCYDAYWEFLGLNGYYPSFFYYGYDMISDTYDYSTLRVGMGDFCYGGAALGSVFVNPGGSVDHARVFNGPETSSNTGYGDAFADSMGYWWYGNRLNTWDASDMARNAAAQNIWPGEAGWTYYNYGDGIWI
jgi:hypothetical protein